MLKDRYRLVPRSNWGWRSTGKPPKSGALELGRNQNWEFAILLALRWAALMPVCQPGIPSVTRPFRKAQEMSMLSPLPEESKKFVPLDSPNVQKAISPLAK